MGGRPVAAVDAALAASPEACPIGAGPGPMIPKAVRRPRAGSADLTAAAPSPRGRASGVRNRIARGVGNIERESELLNQAVRRGVGAGRRNKASQPIYGAQALSRGGQIVERSRGGGGRPTLSSLKAVTSPRCPHCGGAFRNRKVEPLEATLPFGH